MQCDVCAATRPDDERYCARCGAALRAGDPADACTVVLSFDVDGPSGMIQRNPEVERLPSARSFGEYGPTVGAPHLLALLERLDVPASFYVPGWVAERHPRLVERIAAAGHEIGHHGYLHEPPATLQPDQEAALLDRASAVLAGITGAPPRGYRSPAWELSDATLGLLQERGFLYDSSLMGSDAPYLAAPGLVELPVHWSLDDYPYLVFGPGDGRRLMASPSHVLEAWSWAFAETWQRGGVFTLTMHPYIIGRPGRLRVLAELVDHMRTFADVRFARADAVAQEALARAGL